MVGIERVLRRLTGDLADLEVSWALVGGLAVSARSEPRTTRDVDIAVAVAEDRDAQRLVMALRDRGYQIETLLEHETSGRMATVRLLAPGEEAGGIIVDLLFASSGIEPEIVAAADTLEFLADLHIPVARLSHLIAVKILAGRAKDLADIEMLVAEAGPGDAEACEDHLKIIKTRGYDRNRDLQAAFSKVFDPEGCG